MTLFLSYPKVTLSNSISKFSKVSSSPNANLSCCISPYNFSMLSTALFPIYWYIARYIILIITVNIIPRRIIPYIMLITRLLCKNFKSENIIMKGTINTITPLNKTRKLTYACLHFMEYLSANLEYSTIALCKDLNVNTDIPKIFITCIPLIYSTVSAFILSIASIYWFIASLFVSIREIKNIPIAMAMTSPTPIFQST